MFYIRMTCSPILIVFLVLVPQCFDIKLLAFLRDLAFLSAVIEFLLCFWYVCIPYYFPFLNRVQVLSFAYISFPILAHKWFLVPVWQITLRHVPEDRNIITHVAWRNVYVTTVVSYCVLLHFVCPYKTSYLFCCLFISYFALLQFHFHT